jgi:transposase
MRNPTACTQDGRWCKGARASGGGSRLGIDVSKATLTGTLVRARDRRPEWEMTVPNTAAGIARLVRRTAPACPWVVEPTGIDSRAVVAQGIAAGRPVLMAQPKRAKAYLASVQPRAKTDRLDSHGLALYGLAARLRPYPVKSEAMERIDRLLTARKGISRSLAGLRQQRAVLPYAAAPLAAASTAPEAQIAALDRQIATATQAEAAVHALVCALGGVPGIGPVTASAMASCLTSKVFAHPDQFVAYLGLDVRVHDSGQRRGQRALSKQGDAELRRLLYLCAAANVRARDPANPFKQQYAQEMAKGLPTTAALCAVARKLARLCWSLARHGTQYEAARVHRQPTGAMAPRNREASKTP